jgi:hypothetical protein
MAEDSFHGHNNSGDESDVLNEHVQDPGDPDGLVAAEKWRRLQERQLQERQERHPVPASTPPAVYKRKRAWPKVLIVIIVVVVAAYGAYWFGNHEATKRTDEKTRTTASKSQKQSTQAATTATKQYTSTNYSLSFNYPATWTVSDTAAKLTVISPATQLAIPTGSKTSLHVVVTIQNQETAIPGFPSGGAVAALGSNLLVYTQPSSVQRAQTYVSYLGYTTSNGLDAVYVTGNNGYQQGQQIPMSDIVQGDPLISVTFENCTDASCTNGKPVTLSASDWQSSAVSKQVTSLLESLVVQS